MNKPIHEMTQEERNAADCTVVFCKCKRAVFLGVTHLLEKSDYREIGEMVAEGCEVRHMQVVDGRQVDFGCECPKKKDDTTGDLFGQAPP